MREVLKHYHQLGHVGMPGAAMIEIDLKAADEAMASQDVAAMVDAYQRLEAIA